MAPSLDAITTPRPLGPGAYGFEVPDGWQQGRGAFGGFVLALLQRAIRAHAGAPERALRALTGELPAPTLTGPATVHVETLKEGSGVTTVAARLTQGGEVRAHAVAVLGRTRGDEPPSVALAAPALPSWRALSPLSLEGFAPTFTSHFEFLTEGPFPFTGGATREALGWIRLRGGALGDPEAHLIACADAWWPSLFVGLAGPRPIATVSFTLQVVEGLSGLDPEAPLGYRARTLATSGGFASELRELWGEDGRLVALNTQTIAIIR